MPFTLVLMASAVQLPKLQWVLVLEDRIFPEISDTKWLKIEFWRKGKKEKLEDTVTILLPRAVSPCGWNLGCTVRQWRNVARMRALRF